MSLHMKYVPVPQLGPQVFEGNPTRYWQRQANPPQTYHLAYDQSLYWKMQCVDQEEKLSTSDLLPPDGSGEMSSELP